MDPVTAAKVNFVKSIQVFELIEWNELLIDFIESTKLKEPSNTVTPVGSSKTNIVEVQVEAEN